MTPDFDGLPNLVQLKLCECDELKEIHPSIGRLKSLVYLELRRCKSLEMFPPIIQLKKLECLYLSLCFKLRKFPEIQQNMDSLKYLYLNEAGIEVVPSSIAKYCTNLVYLDLRHCLNLKSIGFNFYHLERLEGLDLGFNRKLKELPEEFIDVEYCLEELSLPRKSMNHTGLHFFHRGLVGLEFHDLPRFLRELNLSFCDLGDGDIGSEVCELSNLQKLDLGGNKFSRLHFSLLQLPQLKLLNVTGCKSLVELSELPSSIAVLRADNCRSLKLVGDISNCKWLWKVSLSSNYEQVMSGGDTVLHSMLQGNAIEDHFISLAFPDHEIQKWFVHRLVRGKTFALQLPHNWYDDFCGFLICTVSQVYNPCIRIIIKQEMGQDSQYELWQESNEAPEPGYHATTYVGYVSFSSLRHTAWWNSAYNMMLFSLGNYHVTRFGVELVGVELVPRKSKGDAVQTTKDATGCSEFWDEEAIDRKTFTIKHDLKSSIEILWYPNDPR